MTWMHEDTHFNPKSLNIRTYCKMLSKSIETFTRSAKCFQNRLKPLRAPRNAFKGVWNFCALCEMLSKLIETFTHSAKCFQRRLKLSCPPQNAFKIDWNLHALREMPSRALGNGCALSEVLPESSETSARSAKYLPNPRKPLHLAKQRGTLTR